jgi:hypothetical protein
MVVTMKPIPISLSYLLIACVLAACGGGDDPPLTTRAKADATEALARSLIQTGPCASDTQCGFVTFQTPFHSCSQGEHAPYLLASETSFEVIAAAKEQRQLAFEARALEPFTGLVCAGSVEPPPIPICVQAKCTLKTGFFTATGALQ